MIYTGEAYFSDPSLIEEVERFARKFCVMKALENLSVTRDFQKIELQFLADDENPALLDLTEKPVEVSNNEDEKIASNLDQLKTEEISIDSDFYWESVLESTDKGGSDVMAGLLGSRADVDPPAANNPNDKAWLITLDPLDPNPSDSDSSDSNEIVSEVGRGNKPDAKICAKKVKRKKVKSVGEVYDKHPAHRCELCKLSFPRR